METHVYPPPTAARQDSAGCPDHDAMPTLPGFSEVTPGPNDMEGDQTQCRTQLVTGLLTLPQVLLLF